ncbi:unnamed protein product [Echinostoma caproni]|uniref:M_domain domain-containing protein n=1 Tax=Echinostoma caproni TaxID=27848 RepID=A0A183AGX4_9TREM|nr:unnamed protein product [Echinostoma caproni]
MQQQAQKFTEMEQLLRQFNLQKAAQSANNRVSAPPMPGSALSSQLMSPVAEHTGHPSASLLVQPTYPFNTTHPTTLLTGQQWPYRTNTMPSAGLVQTSIAMWPNEFYAGLKSPAVSTAGLFVPPMPNIALDPCANLVSPQPSLCVSTSRTGAPVMNPGPGHVDLLSQVSCLRTAAAAAAIADLALVLHLYFALSVHSRSLQEANYDVWDFDKQTVRSMYFSHIT